MPDVDRVHDIAATAPDLGPYLACMLGVLLSAWVWMSSRTGSGMWRWQPSLDGRHRRVVALGLAIVISSACLAIAAWGAFLEVELRYVVSARRTVSGPPALSADRTGLEVDGTPFDCSGRLGPVGLCGSAEAAAELASYRRVEVEYVRVGNRNVIVRWSEPTDAARPAGVGPGPRAPEGSANGDAGGTS